MADTDIKAGDTVRLKSGGPLMTVTRTYSQDGEDRAAVAWFDSKQEAKNGIYALIVLEKDDGAPIIA